MSASLVGSEMCIRDSASPNRRPRGWCCSGLHACLRPLRQVLVNALVGPVSYTHLTLPTICSV
eukprot:14022416-Alexandrium_andersonii.AAC.1